MHFTQRLAIRSRTTEEKAHANLFQFTTQPTTDNEALVLTVHPPARPIQNIEHTPCEIVLVIDVSGSMQMKPPPPDGGEETGLSILDLTKHAAKTIVAALNEHDSLAVVTFSKTAKVVQDLTSMTVAAKRITVQNIESLRVQGATNLWAGIREGLKQFEDSTEDRGRTRAVFVLTDGQPNHMCPSKGYLPAIRPLLERSAQQGSPPIQINTFGFGFGIRSGLLHSIAELAGGNYGFIPDCGMIGTVFIHAVANLFATCATNATLRLDIPSECEVLVGAGVQHSVKQHKPKQRISIPLGSLIYGQSRDILLNCNMVNVDELHMEASLQYFANGSLVTDNLTAAYEDDTFYPLTQQRSLYQKTRAKVCEMLDSLFPAQENGERKAVPADSLGPSLKILGDLVEDVRKHPAKDDHLVQSLLNDLAGEDPAGQISLALSKEEYYNRWGKHYLPSLMSAHQKQYCNSFKDPGPLQYGKTSSIFVKSRDELNTIFDDMDIKATELDEQDDASSSQPRVRASNGSRFNSSDNPCFAGVCRILMGDGSTKALQDLRVGHFIETQKGAREVAAIMKTEVLDTPMLKLNGLLITRWHPIYHTSKWVFPVNADKARECEVHYTGYIYSLLLEPSDDPSQHTAIVEGTVCTTMGHGILNAGPTGEPQDVRGHDFLGDYKAVMSSLVCLPKDPDGAYVCGGLERDLSKHTISGFRAQKDK